MHEPSSARVRDDNHHRHDAGGTASEPRAPDRPAPTADEPHVDHGRHPDPDDEYEPL